MSWILSTLKEFDKDEFPDEDSYETPWEMLKRFERNYKMNFILDAAARLYNTKCTYFLDNAMFQEWAVPVLEPKVVDVWCNPPHSMTEKFIRRANIQHNKYNFNAVMIVPANVNGTTTFQRLIENETECFVENHPVDGRPIFLKNGRKTKHPSRNSYTSIVWRKK